MGTSSSWLWPLPIIHRPGFPMLQHREGAAPCRRAFMPGREQGHRSAMTIAIPMAAARPLVHQTGRRNREQRRESSKVDRNRSFSFVTSGEGYQLAYRSFAMHSRGHPSCRDQAPARRFPRLPGERREDAGRGRPCLEVVQQLQAVESHHPSQADPDPGPSGPLPGAHGGRPGPRSPTPSTGSVRSCQVPIDNAPASGFALGAAALFGLSTPLAGLLLGSICRCCWGDCST